MKVDERWDRVIIAIDLDCFYVGVERILNPALVGQPVGIQQKNCLATCSYEARALGATKLSTVSDTKKRIPSLVLINGEDLSNYRVFSKRVFELVRGVVWDQKVERLGLDEVFCDVTAMIDFNLSSDSRNFFHLSSTDPAVGFAFSPSNPPVTYSPFPPHDARPNDPRTALAASLAAHLRQRIQDEIGLSSSSGIGPSKLLAKLLTSMNKPSKQTAFPLSLPAADMAARAQEVVEPLELRRIPGLGAATVSRINTHLGRTAVGAREQEPVAALTVAQARPQLPLAALVQLFPSGLPNGQAIHALLRGVDDTPVTPSPEFPLQITVEDSYPGRKGLGTLEQVKEKVGILLQALIRRLESELLPPPVLGASTSTASAKVRWLRYPSKLRVSVRRYSSSGVAAAHSASAPLPRELFDMSLTVEQRAAVLQVGADKLASALWAKGEGEEVNVVNVGVTDLGLVAPDPEINFTSAGTGATKKAEVDLAVLLELPKDVRKEMMRLHGVDKEQLKAFERQRREREKAKEQAAGRERSRKGGKGREEIDERSGTTVVVLSDDDDDDVSIEQQTGHVKKREATITPSAPEKRRKKDKEAGAMMVRCKKEGCKAQVFPFALKAHKEWHKQQDS